MREMTVRLRFTRHCLGNVKAKDGSGKFLLPKNPSGAVIFLASWHQANMRFAARVLGKHQDEVDKILWDIVVDGTIRKNGAYRRYYEQGGYRRYSLHECYLPDQIIGINCILPTTISDDDFWRLMSLAGQYRGLSPWGYERFGFFVVESLRPRRRPPEESEFSDVAKDEATT